MTRWADLTHPAAERAIERGAVALLPTGATEAHGPHLPLDTDVRIAEACCERAGPKISSRLRLDAYLLPPLAYSVTEYAAPFAGTLGVSAEVCRPYLVDILKSAARTGFRAVCLVNAHLEPNHRYLLREAVKEARLQTACPLVIADPCDRRWVQRLTPELASGKCHAGQYETSILLAAGTPIDWSAWDRLAPVDIDLMEAMRTGKSNFAEMGAEHAYFGDPAAASRSEGHESLETLGEIVCTVVAEALSEEDRPPLGSSDSASSAES